MVQVLDASALIHFLEKQTHYEKVKEILVKAVHAKSQLLMTTVNWGEVRYILARRHGDERTQDIFRYIEQFPIEFVPVDLIIAEQAAVYKDRTDLGFVDCFAAALAKLRKAELVTADKDFKVVEGEIKVAWIV